MRGIGIQKSADEEPERRGKKKKRNGGKIEVETEREWQEKGRDGKVVVTAPWLLLTIPHLYI